MPDETHDETAKRLRDAVHREYGFHISGLDDKHKCLGQGKTWYDCPHIAAALDRLIAYERARGAAERGCDRQTKTGTCIDKKFNAICYGCQKQQELDRLTESAKEPTP